MGLFLEYCHGYTNGAGDSFGGGHCDCNTRTDTWQNKGRLFIDSITGTQSGLSSANQWSTVTISGYVKRVETRKYISGSNYICFGPLYDEETGEIIDNSVSSAQTVTTSYQPFSVSFNNLNKFAFYTSFKLGVQVNVKGDGTRFNSDVYQIWIEDINKVPSSYADSVKFEVFFTPGCYINFENTKNTVINRMTVTNARNFYLPSAPTATGYSFAGWLKNNSGNLQAPGSAQSPGSGDTDITYYGSWTRLYHLQFLGRSFETISEDSGLTSNTRTPLPYVSNSGYDYDDTTDRSYYFKGWLWGQSNTRPVYTPSLTGLQQPRTYITISDDLITGNPDTGGFLIRYYSIWNDCVHIHYYDGGNLLVMKNQGFTRNQDGTRIKPERYTNYPVIDQIVINDEEMSIQDTHPEKRFLGWSTSSSATEVNYVAGDVISSISTDTNFYAVWEDRDSVTINPSVANITTVSFNTTPSAQDGLTYYFNRGLNKKVTLSINMNATNANRYYINSVTGATGTIAANGQRSWTGNDVTNTGSTATSTTINITYYRNLQFFFYLYAIEKNNLAQPNFTTEFYIQENGANGGITSTSATNYNYKYKAAYLNPGDTVTYSTICNNNNYYVATAFTPNGSSITGYYSPSSNSISNAVSISRSQLKAGYSGNNTIASITGNEESFFNSSYTFTVPTGTAGVAFMGSDGSSHKTQRAYIIYEPFHCQYQINNYNYTLNLYATMGYRATEASLVTQDTSVADREQYIIKFFNDVSTDPSYYIGSYRKENSTRYVISNISSQDSDLTLNNYLTFILSGKLASNENYNGFNLWPDQSVAGYNLNNFTGWKIHPTQYMLNNYHSPYIIDVTWSSNDYKCFIILKLPETQENEINIANATEFNTTGWTNISDSNLNRNIYIKEITNTSSTTSINASLKDVVNAGYILKQIDKYTFDGTYNSDCTTETNHTTVTREQLDSGIVLQNWIRTSPDSSGSNDKLSFNKTFTSADSGVVDYYFITYEEGLPIFYPSGENDPKRAIQLFWEGTRAIGLYYENTRLL